MCLGLAPIASAGDLPELKAKGVLKAIAQRDEAPEMLSFTATGAPRFEREMVEGFGRLHDLKVDAVAVKTSEGRIPALSRGEGDVIIGIVETEARKKLIAFTTEVIPAPWQPGATRASWAASSWVRPRRPPGGEVLRRAGPGGPRAQMSAALLALLVLAAQHGEGRYGNPADLESYMARLADPARDNWQKPDAVVKALELRPGQTACDIGAGPGYFTLRLAAAVGPSGRVYGVDVEPAILEALRDRVEGARLTNVTPVLAFVDDPLLPDGLCDLVLIVDTYHHFPERAQYLRRLARSLKGAGRIVNIDYEKKPTPVGPPLEHRISRDQFVSEAKEAGLGVVAEPALLPYQYFVVLAPIR